MFLINFIDGQYLHNCMLPPQAILLIIVNSDFHQSTIKSMYMSASAVCIFHSESPMAFHYSGDTPKNDLYNLIHNFLSGKTQETLVKVPCLVSEGSMVQALTQMSCPESCGVINIFMCIVKPRQNTQDRYFKMSLRIKESFLSKN